VPTLTDNSPIVWLGAFAAIALMLWALMYDHKKRQSRTTAEYEEAVRKGEILPNALLKAGMLEMEKLLKPSLEASIEHVEDENQGRTRTQKKGGNGRRKKRMKTDTGRA